NEGGRPDPGDGTEDQAGDAPLRPRARAAVLVDQLPDDGLAAGRGDRPPRRGRLALPRRCRIGPGDVSRDPPQVVGEGDADLAGRGLPTVLAAPVTDLDLLGTSMGPAIHTCPSRITTRRWPGCRISIASGDAGSSTVPLPGSLNRFVQSRFVQPSSGSPMMFRSWSVTSSVIVMPSRSGR